MEEYFARYGDIELHRRMISDSARTDAFAAAIAKTVKKGDVVLDVGTGTGILAMLAARAGAKQVYAVDYAQIAQTAANLVKANGLSDKVKVLRGAAAEVQLPEPADLIVSEWLGNFAFVEGMLDDLTVARNNNLAPKGRMLPSKVSVHVAPIDDGSLYHGDGPGFWNEPVHGLDMSSLEPLELKQGRAVQMRVDPTSMIARGIELYEVDLRHATPLSPWKQGAAEIKFERDGVLNGFCAWFVAELCPGVVLDTSPHHKETHWAQTYLPFPTRVVRKGKTATLMWSVERDPDERRYVTLALKLGRSRVVYHLE